MRFHAKYVSVGEFGGGINRRAGRAVRVLAVVFWTNVMTSTRSALAVYRIPYIFGG